MAAPLHLAKGSGSILTRFVRHLLGAPPLKPNQWSCWISPPPWQARSRSTSSAPVEVTGVQKFTLQRYMQLISCGVLRDDPAQRQVVAAMDVLTEELVGHHQRMKEHQTRLLEWLSKRQLLRMQMLAEEMERERAERAQREAQKHSLSRWLFRKRRVERGPGRMVRELKREKALDAALPPRPLPPLPPQGIYLFGNVGCGKTLLMDLLFETAENIVGRRRRLHFHAAMLELHQRMHRHWQEQQQRRERKRRKEERESHFEEEEDGDEVGGLHSHVLDAVVNEFMGGEEEAYGASLLCFDEIQVVDVFTAVALPRLLGRLMEKGVVLVATSNRPPRHLNKDGLQRHLFEQFVRQLEQQCRPLHIQSDTDYRRIQTGEQDASAATYFWPLNERSQEEVEKLWQQAVEIEREKGKCEEEERRCITVMFGRTLQVPRNCGGIARFAFDDLCNRPVGAADYIALAQQYHTVFVTDIPSMSMRIRDQARRFITLIDELYNFRRCLVCTAAAPPDELFLGHEEGPLVDLESLQFETAVEGGKLRRNVGVEGGVAPIGSSQHERSAIERQLSGREEEFAFRRAISRLVEMQKPSYTRTLARGCGEKTTPV